MKESVVEIPEGSGHLYRYGYEAGSQKTVYKGPVGDAPTISEGQFEDFFASRRVYPAVLDAAKAESIAERAEKEIDAPYVNVRALTTGFWKDTPSVSIRLSLDPQSEWRYGYWENSRHITFDLETDGQLKMRKSYKVETKFRKRRLKNPDDVINKINEYLAKAKAEG